MNAGCGGQVAGAKDFSPLRCLRSPRCPGASFPSIGHFPSTVPTDTRRSSRCYDRGWGERCSYNNRFKVGGVKITLDGSPQGRTAFFTTPYLAGGPAGEENWSGEPSFPQELANQMVKKVYDLDVPLIIHTNGDASIGAFLEAYEFARDGDYSRPWNVTTIHTQFMRPDHIPKFAQCGVRPSFYTLHTFYFAATHIANRGREQGSYNSPMRDAIDAGLQPTNHTDFVVSPLDQMIMLCDHTGLCSPPPRELAAISALSP